MFTTTDLNPLAAALRESRHRYAGDQLVYDAKVNQWKATVSFVASMLERNNPRFNRERFLDATGYDEV